MFKNLVLKRLEKHVTELEEFGLLPENWFWYKNKVIQLKKIDDNLIKDLKKLHEFHQTIGDILPNILPILVDLYKDLNKLLEEKGPSGDQQEKESILINDLCEKIKEILIRHRSHPHLTSEEKEHFALLHKQDLHSIHSANKLKNEPQAIKDHEGYRYIKKMWNQRVDRQFIESIITIHWVFNFKSLKNVFDVNNKHELSSVGYLKLPYLCPWGYGMGVIIKGYVTWASNWDARSDNTAISRKDPRFSGQKYSYGDSNVKDFTKIYMIFNKKTFTEVKEYYSDYAKKKVRNYNELLVDNWKITKIIIDKQLLEKNFLSLRDESKLEHFNVLDLSKLYENLRILANEKKVKLVDNYDQEI